MPRRKQSVGVIGLGIIGSRVASHLRRAGYEVWVWNRSPKAEPNFLSSAAEVAESAEILLTFVSDGPALIEVMKAVEPVLSARHLVLNHATVGPDEVTEAAEIARRAGADLIDAPFTGSLKAAEAGELVYYVGGSSEALTRARPVLEVSSKSILEIGEIGQASLVKIATNLISAAAVEALSEAMGLLEKNGVPLEKFAQAIELNAARSGVSDAKVPLMLAGKFDPNFSLKNMFKDVQLLLAAAERSGMELPAANATAGALMAGMEHGWADLDFSSVSKHYGFPGKEPLAVEAVFAASDAGKPKKRRSLFGSGGTD
ncbi:MAG: NAD(P)-dependent oxidoreductase [Chthoniobacterales bacterium]